MAFTASDDVNILQTSDSSVVGAGAGNDRYVLSASTLSNNQKITISDSSGANALQLVGGLVISSSQVTSNALLLTLNNGAQITLLGANTFSYITGGDAISGTGGTTQNYNSFVTQSLGTTVPAGNTPNSGGSVTVNNNGGTTAGGNPVQSIALTPAAASVNEGATIAFNLSTQNVANGTVYTYQITGVAPSDVVGGTLSGTVTVNSGVGVISVPLAADSTTEGAETLTVTLIGTGLPTAPTASVTVNDTSLTPVSTYALTSGIDTIGSGQTSGNSNGTADLNTLNNGDRIVDDSTTDNDTLIAQVIGGTTLDNTVNFTNIENVGFNVLSGTLAVDALNYGGLKVLALGGPGSLTVDKLQLPSTVLRLLGTNGNLSVTHNATGVGTPGVTDTVTVDLVGTTGGTVTLGAGVEALRLSTMAGQTNTLTAVAGASFTTLQVTGGGEITLLDSVATPIAIPTTVTTVLATDTARASLAVAGAATSVFTGAGNDTVRFSTALVTSSLVSAGLGTDTLILGGPNNLAGVISGVETIQLTQAGSSLDMANVTGGVALDFQGGGNLTVSNATAGTSVKTSTAGTTGNISFGYADTVVNQTLNLDLAQPITVNPNPNPNPTLLLKNAANVTVAVSRTGTQTFGAVTLDETAGGTDTTRALTLNASGAGSALTTGAIGSAGTLTSLTLRASGLGSSVTIGDIAAPALQSLTIAAANGGASIGAISGSTALSTIDIEVGAGGLGLNAAATDIAASNAAGINSIALRATGGNIGAANTLDAMGVVTAVNALVIDNANGGINTVTLTGSGDIFTALNAGSAGVGRVQSVNSTATGGVTLTITNSTALDMPGTTVVLGNAVNGKQNNLTLASDRADTVNGGTGVDVIVTGAGNDVIAAGGGNDTITGGAGSDILTGNAGNDTFVFSSTAETRNALFSLNDTTNTNLDRVTDFNGNGAAAGDVFKLAKVGTMAVMSSEVTFNNMTMVDITASSTLLNGAINNFTQLTAALNTAVTTASDSTSARVLDITVTSGNLAGRYLLVNDGVANVDLANDLIINITGVTGAVNAADFSFV